MYNNSNFYPYQYYPTKTGISSLLKKISIGEILNGTQKNIDVCLINNNPFVYVACMGAYVDISYATPRKLKEKYGKLAYVIYGIQQLKQNLHFYNVKYEVNGVEYEKRFI